MNELEKIKEMLPKDVFPQNEINYTPNDTITAIAYPNYWIAESLNEETERKFMSIPVINVLHSNKHCYAIMFFPKGIDIRNPHVDLSQLDSKWKSRYENLNEAFNKGNIDLWTGITLPKNEFAKLKLRKRKKISKKDDYKDDEADTMCQYLTKPVKPYIELKQVSTHYNTILIMKNAKETCNQSLSYYRNNTSAFYNDIVINYIIEHAGLLAPETFKYAKETYEVRVQYKQLKKLFPHRTFKLCLPNGVTLEYVKQNRQQPKQPEEPNPKPKKERISKNDIAIFTFTNEFLAKFRSIVSRESSNKKNPESFLKFPVWFLLEALKDENLTSRGFNFLLWLLPYFRMSSPRLFHHVRTILKETGADMKHGYKKPIATLTSYFTYLIRCQMLQDVETPNDLVQLKLDAPPKRSVLLDTLYRKELLITLQKPKVPENPVPKKVRKKRKKQKSDLK